MSKNSQVTLDKTDKTEMDWADEEEIISLLLLLLQVSGNLWEKMELDPYLIQYTFKNSNKIHKYIVYYISKIKYKETYL